MTFAAIEVDGVSPYTVPLAPETTSCITSINGWLQTDSGSVSYVLLNGHVAHGTYVSGPPTPGVYVPTQVEWTGLIVCQSSDTLQVQAGEDVVGSYVLCGFQVPWL